MGTIKKIVILLISSVAPLAGMESCTQKASSKEPCTVTWDAKLLLKQIQKATPKKLKKALFRQAYMAFLLAQRINFMWNRDENQAPLVANLITYDDTIMWFIDGKEYHFEDPVQVAWLYTLSTKLTTLQLKKKLSGKSLFGHAWTIRLFLDDCSNNMPQSNLESEPTDDSDCFLKASTIAIYNTKILDSIINLGIFKSPPQGIRARYVEKMISLFPQRTELCIPPLNNQILIKHPHASQTPSALKRPDASTGSNTNGTTRVPIDQS